MPKTYVKEHVLEAGSSTPVSVVRGAVNDVFDGLGLPRPDEVIPLPAELAATLGIPTVEEAIPTPKEVGERLVGGTRRLPIPPLPSPREMAERTYD